ncbi:MAG: lysophospholipid acyltransferase family protein [Spirochaetales bacterium]
MKALKNFIAVIKFMAAMIGTVGLLRRTQKYAKNGNKVECDRTIKAATKWWSDKIFSLLETTVEVVGSENVPKDTAALFVCNHQGATDIPLILGYVDKPIAFIAKIELKKAPILSSWMELMQCTFIDRKSHQQSIKAMESAVEKLKNGYSQLVFPEGTRSHGGPIKEFKSGSFKLAFRAEVPVVPVTIDGTWKVLDKTHKFSGVRVKLTIHPPIETKGLAKEELQKIPKKAQDIISAALPEEHLNQAYIQKQQ